MKKGYKSIIASIAAAVMAVSAIPAVVFADTASADTQIIGMSRINASQKDGWYSKGGSKYYYEKGKMVAGNTKLIDGKLYLFGKSGALLTDGIYTVNDKKYCTDKTGRVAANKWVKTKYTSDANIYYYADSTGAIIEFKAVKKDKKCTKLLINGKSDIRSYIKTYYGTGGLHSIDCVVLDKDRYFFDYDSGKIIVPANTLSTIDEYEMKKGKLTYTRELFGASCNWSLCTDNRVFKYRLVSTDSYIYTYNVNESNIKKEATKGNIVFIKQFPYINDYCAVNYIEYVFNPTKDADCAEITLDYYNKNGQYMTTYTEKVWFYDGVDDNITNNGYYWVMDPGNWLDDKYDGKVGDIRLNKIKIFYADGTSAVPGIIDLSK